MQLVFWSAAAFIAYTMAGYAVCLWLLSLVIRETVRPGAVEPTISVLIVVRGGERVIEGKLCNCLEQDYPREKVQIAVVCDGPAPATEAIVERYAGQGVMLIRAVRQGKNGCLRLGLEATSSEVVVFTDVGVTMERDALRLLACNFADSRVGCVSSEDATRPSDGNAEPMFISFDSALRRLEGRVCTLIGASGALFAARRSICRRWLPVLSSDFFLPLHAIEDGLDAVVDPRVKGYLSAVRVDDEFQRKMRTIVHGIDVLEKYAHLLNPFRYGLAAWELASHKLFRWLLPAAFLVLLVSNAFLWNAGWFYRAILCAQFAVLLAGLAAMMRPRLSRLLPFRVAGFLAIGNMATVWAWVCYFRRERYAMWEPSKRAENKSAIKEGCEQYADQ
ncbi:MAG: glycosyltransferase [Acidobacteriota bacterium]|nr:glycosyltransferase [Acidobacteriota bacterium]